MEGEVQLTLGQATGLALIVGAVVIGAAVTITGLVLLAQAIVRRRSG